jgi:hypothetical protein
VLNLSAAELETYNAAMERVGQYNTDKLSPTDAEVKKAQTMLKDGYQYPFWELAEAQAIVYAHARQQEKINS